MDGATGAPPMKEDSSIERIVDATVARLWTARAGPEQEMALHRWSVPNPWPGAGRSGGRRYHSIAGSGMDAARVPLTGCSEAPSISDIRCRASVVVWVAMSLTAIISANRGRVSGPAA